MLTRDLLRFRVDGDRLQPRLLRATPAVVELAGRLLDHWRGGLGAHIGDLEDAAQTILHGSRQLLVGRGLQKVLVDACLFQEPATGEDLRARAFLASAARLRQPETGIEEHLAVVAADVGLGPAELVEALYADHPDRAVLTEAPAWTAEQFIGLYNLALCQGLLLGTQEMEVQVLDPDRGLHRRLLRALRWRRLLAEAGHLEGGGLRLRISGPAAVLDQRTAYGLQFALFLPALCCARRWQARATVLPPRGELPAVLDLSEDLGLPGTQRSLEHVPSELRDWLKHLAAKLPGWQAREAEPLVVSGGEVILPDLTLDDGRGPVHVELFHRWHRNALERRLSQAVPDLLIGVDRALAKQAAVAPLLESPAFRASGFLFSDLPVPRALAEVLARVRA